MITPAAEAVKSPAATAAPASVPSAAEARPETLTPNVLPDLNTAMVAHTLPVNLIELRPRVISFASRAAARRQVRPRPVPVARPAGRPESTGPMPQTTHSQRATDGRHSAARHHPRKNRSSATTQRVIRQRTTKRTRTVRRTSAARHGMSGVVAYARAQVGKRYSRGAVGPNTFDCSGLTMRAYRTAGLSLPHSSGGQAARARPIARSQARPGDLVVGPGHVGVYMGGGMMVDAGNPRTGVVYRRLYAGLHIERL